MALRANLDDQPTELNLTPMLDVVFNLLIFFLLSSTYITDHERQLDLELPAVGGSEALSEAPDELGVVVLADGKVMLGDEPLSLDDLRQRLVEAIKNYPDQAVAIRGDSRAPYEHIARVLALCKQIGVAKLDVLVLEER